MKNSYGLQLYSVRDITQENFELAIEKVAALGYKAVETAGFFGKSAVEVKKIIEEHGLSLVGTHSSINDLTPEKIDETIAYHKELGNPNYIIPGADFSTKEKADNCIEIINYALPRLREVGINLAFHNHSAEYQTVYDSVSFMDMLKNKTEIDFEIDTYWAWCAGVDPVEELERLKDRIKIIHLKDGFTGGVGMALGEGDVPLVDIIAKAKEIGAYIVVESETLNPTGVEEVARCANYLKGLE